MMDGFSFLNPEAQRTNHRRQEHLACLRLDLTDNKLTLTEKG